MRYQHNPSAPESLTNGPVSALIVDRNGVLWVGTAKASVLEPPFYGGLNRYDKNREKFIRYQHNPKDENSLFDNRVTAIYEDSLRQLWVGTAGYGLHLMDRDKNNFRRFSYNPAQPEMLSLPAPVNKNFM